MERSVLMVSQPTTAGVAQCVLDWSTGVGQRGWRVSVACPTDGWLGTAAHERGIDVHRWDSQRSPHKAIRSESQHLRRIVAATEPEVVFLHGSKAGLIGRLVLRGRRPTLFAPHAWSFEAVHGATEVAAQAWERTAARWTTGFVCVSQAERELGLRRGIRGRYTIARNGVDLQALRPPADRAALRELFAVPLDARVAVCVGRVCEQKGQDVLVQAWHDRPDRRLAIVGDGPDLAALSARPSAGVHFTGGVDRATALQWLALADVAVLPSRWEGMALVPLEALAMGTPVVATDVNGVREAITADVGTIVPPGDPQALAGALDRWLAVPPDAAVRTRCRDRVTSQFDLNDTIAVVADALSEAAAS